MKDVRLEKITNLAENMRDLENEITVIQKRLKALTNQHDQISAVELPELMAEINLSSFTLSDGTKINIAPVFKISVTKDKMESAYQWLVKHQHDGMVKTRVLLPTGVDNYVLNQIAEYLREKVGCDVQTERVIHPQTLGAWGRECEREGIVIPEELFSIFRSNKTVIG
jgi:hypothetical protein